MLKTTFKPIGHFNAAVELAAWRNLYNDSLMKLQAEIKQDQPHVILVDYLRENMQLAKQRIIQYQSINYLYN